MQNVNIEGITKDEFDFIFSELLSLGFSMTVKLVGQCYTITASRKDYSDTCIDNSMKISLEGSL